MTHHTKLVASLRDEQRARWECGDFIRIEAFLRQHPSLGEDSAALFDLIWAELVLRQERADPPRLEDYVQRFGQLTDGLPALFENLCQFDQAERTQTGHVSATPLATLELSRTPNIGTVPGYEVLDELGRGGMGVVYKARHVSLKRLVALKMILAGAHSDTTARARFRTEAEAIARLQHPNIVQIYEIGEHEERPFLCLEYVEGGSLKQMVAGAGRPEREAARLVETIARALHYTHQRGILHRDLNPNNVLLTADGTPKVTDFGLAKLLDADAGQTRTDALLGTPNYMSPEQAAGDTKRIGVPSDVYALGTILYELLTGRVPFQGTTLLKTLEQVRTQEPVRPRRLRGPVSLDLETICMRCLEKAPGNRYPSAAALAEDLHRFLEGQPILARPVPAWQRFGRVARRRPALVAVVVALTALLGLGLTAWSYFRATDQLAHHHAEERYQKFVQRRNDAHFYGLLTADQGSLFLGAEATGSLQTAETAAREALALASVDPDSATVRNSGLPASRKAEITEDCYALLLLLAGVRAQQQLPDKGDKERYHEALRILDRAGKLGLTTRSYYLRRAHMLEQLGESEEAKKNWDRAATVPLEGALDHFLIGEERYRRGDWGEATNSFNRALSLQPGHFWAQFLLAVCHLRSQHWEAAKAGLNACLGQRPDFVWAYLFRSFANEKLHALPEAEADFQQALQHNPNEDARYVLFLTRGILHFNQQEFEQAAADFRSAIALKPGQYNAYLNLAHVYLADGQFEQADEQVRKALWLGPPTQVVADYHLNRGRNLFREKQYEEAVRACYAAAELAPGQPLVAKVRARAQLALGCYEQAEQSFDQYLRQGGDTTPDVFRDRGLARMKLGKYPDAAEDYSRVLEREPNAEFYQHRGWAHFFSDAWKLALRDFSKALEMDPRPRDAYTGRGLAHVMLGHYREAVADAEEALRRKPDTREMMHNISCIFAQAAKGAEADQAVADDYRSRALEAVRQTLQMVPLAERRSFFRDKILADEALSPIRQGAGFKRLQEEYTRP